MDFLDDEYKEIAEIFKSETEEHLDKINQSLVDLEKNPMDNFLIDNIFREAHSLKGSARMLGFDDIQNLAHQLESVMSQIKTKIFDITPSIIDLLCENTDCIKSIVDKSVETKGTKHNPEVDEVMKKFDALLTQGVVITESFHKEEPTFFGESADNNEYSKEEENREPSGNIGEVFKELDAKIVEMKGKDVYDFCSDFLPVLNKATNSIESNHIKDVLVNIKKVIECARHHKYTIDKDFYENIYSAVELVCSYVSGEDIDHDSITLYSKRLQILYEMIEIYAQDMPVSLPEVMNIKTTPKSSQKSLPPQPAQEQKVESASPQQKIEEMLIPSETWAIKTLRVDTRKLDHLVNQSGELIVAKIKTKEHVNQVEEILTSVEDWYKTWNKNKRYLRYFDRKIVSEADTSNMDVKLYSRSMYNFIEENTDKIVDIMGKIQSLYRTIQEDDTRLSLVINDLENLIKSIRVLPLATIFHMLPRMVRDIARARNKEIELIVSGSETSADKKIIEEIKSPLIHIIRNAADHGIESREERIAKGKDPVGKIYLTARHVDNNILIEITDDGRGIDIEKIKEKVLEKKILSPDELDAMTPQQIMNIIFWPGFTTEKEVTEISGRGVGLDIVHTKISQLNGKVNITSVLDKRCTVQIQLPVTMATLKSFLIETGSRFFAMPASYIKTAFWVKKNEIFTKENYKHVIHKNHTIPVFNLDEVLNIETNKEDKSNNVIVLVVQDKENEAGFIVEKLIGEQEILHKSLPAPLVRVPNVSGITTLGSGELCLILNGSELIRSAFDGSYLKSTFQPEFKKEKNKKYRILIAEDSATTGILQKNILKNAGYDVDIAKDGLEAFNKVLGTNEYDLLISDIDMPGLNGLELTKKLREDYQKPIPIIIVSASDVAFDERTLIQMGANKFIKKSRFNQEELLRTIEQLLSVYSKDKK